VKGAWGRPSGVASMRYCHHWPYGFFSIGEIVTGRCDGRQLYIPPDDDTNSRPDLMVRLFNDN